MRKEELAWLLGKRIVELRSRKNMSQADLARECGKDPQSLERIENGKTNPTFFYLLEIAGALKVHIRELFEFDYKPEKPS